MMKKEQENVSKYARILAAIVILIGTQPFLDSAQAATQTAPAPSRNASTSSAPVRSVAPKATPAEPVDKKETARESAKQAPAKADAGWNSSRAWGGKTETKTAPPAAADAKETANPAKADARWNSSGAWGGGAAKPLPASVPPKDNPTFVAPGSKIAAGASPINVAGTTRPSTSAAKSDVIGEQARKEASQKAFARMQREKATFEHPADPRLVAAGTSAYAGKPMYTEAARTYSPARHYEERDRWMRTNGFPQENVIHLGRPSFGAWDAVALWSLMRGASSNDDHARWFHDHRNDPGVLAWKDEAKRLAAENDEIRTRLRSLEEREAAFVASGTKPDPDREVPGLPLVAILAPEAIPALGGIETAENGTPTISVATGNQKGVYHAFCETLRAKAIDLTVSCLPSNGSEDNVSALAAGKVGAALAQAGTAAARGGPAQVGAAYGATLFPERILLIANEKAGVTAITDLDPAKHGIVLMGSGAAAAWKDAERADPSLARFKAIATEGTASLETAETIAAKENSVGLVVIGPASPLLAEIDVKFGKNLRLVGVPWRLGALKDQSGNSLYWDSKLPSRSYSAMQRSAFPLNLFSGIPTTATSATLLVSKKWLDAAGSKAQVDLERSIKAAIEAFEPTIAGK
jgi:TRAP-type uncharacterized transport system substrate-binding protein